MAATGVKPVHSPPVLSRALAAIMAARMVATAVPQDVPGCELLDFIYPHSRREPSGRPPRRTAVRATLSAGAEAVARHEDEA